MEIGINFRHTFSESSTIVLGTKFHWIPRSSFHLWNISDLQFPIINLALSKVKLCSLIVFTYEWCQAKSSTHSCAWKYTKFRKKSGVGIVTPRPVTSEDWDIPCPCSTTSPPPARCRGSFCPTFFSRGASLVLCREHVTTTEYKPICFYSFHLRK